MRGNRAIADAASPRPAIARPWWSTERTNEGVSPVSLLMDLMDSIRWEEWMDDSACVDAGDPDAWFPSKGQLKSNNLIAIRICSTCPVRKECLDYAMRYASLPGIWGGVLESKRRKAIRKRAAR